MPALRSIPRGASSALLVFSFATAQQFTPPPAVVPANIPPYDVDRDGFPDALNLASNGSLELRRNDGQARFLPPVVLNLLTGYGEEVLLPAAFDAVDRALLTDPQTSGGLLVSCAPDALDDVLGAFVRHGFERAAIVGSVEAGPPRLAAG